MLEADKKGAVKMRREHDSIGVLAVPEEAYYGVQSLRGQENFPITGQRLHPQLIRALAEVKKAAARSNRDAGLLARDKAEAILRACDEVIAGGLQGAFIVDPIQGGAGTSANMNANEVIANRAIELLGGEKGDYSLIHPNDHVNMGQSTNDVFPTAGKIAAVRLLRAARGELCRLRAALEEKALEFDDVLKMGRTQLQDAVPVRLGQSFAAWAAAARRDEARLVTAEEKLLVVNLGGTAIGTSLNADPRYLQRVVPALAELTGLPLRRADDLIDATQNLDCFVEVSGLLKTCAVDLSKLANDLRLLSMGPRAGISEIALPARQNGSSIMPGKVNPVLPEVVNQVAFRIMGNDATITLAAEAGQLELNAFEPVLLYSLFESAELLRNAVRTFVDHCVTGIRAERENCRRMVERSAGVAAALCPLIGYERSAVLAKEAVREEVPVRLLAEREGVLPAEQLQEVLEPLHMTGPARCGA